MNWCSGARTNSLKDSPNSSRAGRIRELDDFEVEDQDEADHRADDDGDRAPQNAPPQLLEVVEEGHFGLGVVLAGQDALAEPPHAPSSLRLATRSSGSSTCARSRRSCSARARLHVKLVHRLSEGADVLEVPVHGRVAYERHTVLRFQLVHDRFADLMRRNLGARLGRHLVDDPLHQRVHGARRNRALCARGRNAGPQLVRTERLGAAVPLAHAQLHPLVGREPRLAVPALATAAHRLPRTQRTGVHHLGRVGFARRTAHGQPWGPLRPQPVRESARAGRAPAGRVGGQGSR